MPTSSHVPLRLFLDAGVLILASLPKQFRAVIADPIAVEFTRAVDRKVAGLPDEEAQKIRVGVARWLKIARPVHVPWPTDDELQAHADLFAAVRHRNDMPSVTAAVLARPDWVLSTNTEHWNQDLARRTRLRIATPFEFLSSLHA